MRVITLKPTDTAQTAIVLQAKKSWSDGFRRQYRDTFPHIQDNQYLSLYDDLKSKGIQVGERMTLPTGTVFNFADDENNYFAVRQTEQS